MEVNLRVAENILIGMTPLGPTFSEKKEEKKPRKKKKKKKEKEEGRENEKVTDKISSVGLTLT